MTLHLAERAQRLLDDPEGWRALVRLDDTLALIDRVEERSRERMAQTGEKPRWVLIGVDRLKVVPVDPPPPLQRQEGDG